MTGGAKGGDDKSPSSTYEEARRAALDLPREDRERLIAELRASIARKRGRRPRLSTAGDYAEDPLFQLAVQLLILDPRIKQQEVIKSISVDDPMITNAGLRERVRSLWADAKNLAGIVRPLQFNINDLASSRFEKSKIDCEKFLRLRRLGVIYDQSEPISTFLDRHEFRLRPAAQSEALESADKSANKSGFNSSQN